MNSINPGPGPQDRPPGESLQSTQTQNGNQQGVAPAASQPGNASPSATATALSQADLANLQAILAALSDEQLLMVLAQLPAYQLARALEGLLKPVGDAACTPQVRSETAPDPVSVTDPADSRGADRARVFRVGKIIYNNKMSVSDCHIRDLSNSGCRVVLESIAGIPDNFTLHILTGDTKYECEVAWRKSNMMGLRFIA